MLALQASAGTHPVAWAVIAVIVIAIIVYLLNRAPDREEPDVEIPAYKPTSERLPSEPTFFSPPAEVEPAALIPKVVHKIRKLAPKRKPRKH